MKYDTFFKRWKIREHLWLYDRDSSHGLWQDKDGSTLQRVYSFLLI